MNTDNGQRPTPTVRPPRHRATDRLLQAACYPLIAGVCGGIGLWALHHTGYAIAAAAAAGTGVAAALFAAAGVLAAQRMRYNPAPAAAALLIAASAAAWVVLPLAGLGWLRAAVAAAAVWGLAQLTRWGIRHHRRRAAYSRWAQSLAPVLAQATGQLEQVLAGLTGVTRRERVTAPHFGAAPHAAWDLRVTKWAGRSIRVAVLRLPAHTDISNPDFLARIRDALTKRAGVKYLKTSVDQFRDQITITVLAGPEDEAAASSYDLAVERARQAAGFVLPGAKVDPLEWDDAEAADGQAAAGGVARPLKKFRLTYDQTMKVTPAENRDKIREHLSMQLYGDPSLLRTTAWYVETDTAEFHLRREFPPMIPSRPIDTAALYGTAQVVPFADDEDGDLAAWLLSRTARPHGLISGPTGTGKTVTIVTIAIRAARIGCEVHGCDPKRIELRGLRGWPGVTKIATRVTDMIKLIEEDYAEMHRRYEAVETGRAREEDFHRIVLIIDEYMVFVMLVAIWWEANKPAKAPKVHPVIGMIGEMLAMSRGANFNVLIGTQRPDAVYFPPGARDNMAFRVSLGKLLSPQAAQMMWNNSRTGTDLPEDAQGLGIVSTPKGPRLAKMHYTPNPADGLSEEELEQLRALLPPGATWNGPLPATAPDPGFEDTASAAETAGDSPVVRFLFLVRVSLRTFTAHLTDAGDGGPPATGDAAALYGWGAGPHGSPLPKGTWIGCAAGDTGNGRRVYLDPKAAYAAAASLSAEIGVPFTVPRSKLDDALHDSGLLETEKDSGGKTRWTVRRPLPGRARARVWDFPEEAVLGDDPPPVPPRQAQPGPGPAGAAIDPGDLPAAALPAGAVILIPSGDGIATQPVTVDSTEPDPADPTKLTINYRDADGTPNAITVEVGEPICLATPLPDETEEP